MKSSCYWCGLTHKCIFSHGNDGFLGPKPCGENCGDNGPVSCWKGAGNGNCPVVEYCSSVSNCKQCTQSGCYWCGATEKCMEATAWGLLTPCQYKNETCRNLECWVGGKDSQCPDVACSALHNCGDCTSHKCNWCHTTGTCLETGDNGGRLGCGYNGSRCNSDDCLVSSNQACAPFNSSFCSQFHGNCSTCVNVPFCNYCAESQLCYPNYAFCNQDGPCTPVAECAPDQRSSVNGPTHPFKFSVTLIIVIAVAGAAVLGLSIFGILAIVFHFKRRGYVPIYSN